MESLRIMECTRIFQFVLFMEVFCAMTMATQICPYNTTFQYEIYPELQLPASVGKVDVASLAKTCKCIMDTLTCSSLEFLVPLYTGPDAINITSINLWDGNINNLSRNSLPPGLKEIYFNNQPLTTISDDAFINSAQTLNYLTIIGGNLRQLPKALYVLTNLISLHIQDNPIQVWNDSILTQIIANITNLQLQNVSLTEWPESLSFSRVIVNLDLSGNPLKSIPDKAFLSFKDTLKELDLGHTGLTEVPLALSDLSNLTELDLSGITLNNGNDMEQLASMPFAERMIFINLEGSQLKALPNFSAFTSLTAIILNNNSISDVTSGSFPSSLTNLFLNRNRFPSVPTTIANLPHLTSLYLSDNRITTIEPGSLPPSLARLDLTNNKITVITNTTFLNMANLTSLQLSYNNISTIEPSAFSDLVSLKTLSFGETFLQDIPLFIAKLPRDIDLFMYSDRHISCPCPAPNELVEWLALSNKTVYFLLTCDSYRSLEWYLTTGCQSTTTSTTVTSPGGATTLQCRLFSINGSLFLLTTVFLFFLY